MHLIQALAAGVNGAENGTATITVRGTSTNATYYTQFDGGDGGTTGTLTLDSNGGASVYVDQLVDVTVSDSSGTTVRTFTEMVGAANVEVKSQSFTGTHYDTAASAAGNPTTLLAVLDKWRDNAGGTADDVDWKVDVGGTATAIATVAGATEGLVFNVMDPQYGATGDGTTDDTTAVQAAMTAAAGGGTVFFPKGTYRVTGALNMTESCSLVGVKPGVSAIVHDSASADILNLTTGGSSPHVEIKNLRFYHSQSNTGIFLDVNATADVRIENCFVDDTDFDGATLIDWAGNGGSCVLVDSTFEVAAATGKWFVNTSGSAKAALVARNCLFKASNAAWAPSPAGIDTDIARITSCVFDASSSSGGTPKFMSFNGAAGSEQGVMVVGNYFIGHATPTVVAMEANAFGATSNFVEAANAFKNVDVHVSTGAGVTDLEDSPHSIVGSRGFLADSEATVGSVTYTVNPSRHRAVHLVRTTSTGDVGIDIDTAEMVPPGHEFDFIFENSAGGAVNVSFSATYFEGTHAGVNLSVANGDIATWRFVSVDDTLTTSFVQVGAHIAYTP